MKIIKGKKGQKLSKGINIALTIIISVIVLFQIFTSLTPEAQDAGNRFSDETKCGEAGCFFNSTSPVNCLINSSTEGQGISCPNDVAIVPLASLFGSSGLIILLLVLFLFIMVFKIVIPKRR